MKTQLQIFYEEQRKIAERDILFTEMVRDGSMTNQQLQKLVDKWPHRYGCYANFIGRLHDEVESLTEGSLEGRIKHLETSHDILGQLTNYMLCNYNDDHWDSTTRELLEEANAHIGGEPIVWIVHDDEDYGGDYSGEHEDENQPV